MEVDGATGAKAPGVTATGIGSIALLGSFIFQSIKMLRSRRFESILVWFILVWFFSSSCGRTVNRGSIYLSSSSCGVAVKSDNEVYIFQADGASYSFDSVPLSFGSFCLTLCS